MTSSKILLRSQILELISKLKTLKNFSDKNVEFAIEQLKEVGDDDFAIQLLLKEINCQDSRFDCILALIAKEISSSSCEKQVWVLLNSKTVSDRKKLFLINLLREMGSKIDYNNIQSFVSDPDQVVDMETEIFLQIAKINPEAQIDFLDFFFTVGESDKNLLLSSIIEDFTGDELANVLAPIIYFDPLDKIIPTCLEALKKCKSYLAFEPLNWIINEVNDPKLKQQAKKIINELKMMGLREIYSKKELFKENFENSTPLGYWVSPIDGANNFSLVFARQRDGEEISTFFTVINLENGTSACFGFDGIDIKEFEKILRRFFTDSYMIRLDIPLGQKLLEDSIKKTYKLNQKVPYELLCWRSLTYDIESCDDEAADVFANDLQKIKLNEFDFEKVLKDESVENWFFKPDENIEFDSLINQIIEMKPETIEEIENLIEEKCQSIVCSKENSLIEILNNKLLHQAYFLTKIDNDKIANALFSLIEPSEFKTKFLNHLFKKSIYQYFLDKEEKPSAVAAHVFLKNRNNGADIDHSFYIKLIESKWVADE